MIKPQKSGGLLVVDGVHIKDCTKAAGGIYAYNQGILLLGLRDLTMATGNSTLRTVATGLIAGTQEYFGQGSETKVMADYDAIMGKGDGGCDGQMFKGVLIRYLSYALPLVGAKHSAQYQQLAQYIRNNTDSLWHRARTPAAGTTPPLPLKPAGLAIFSADWRGELAFPGTVFNESFPQFIPSTSALDAFNADVRATSAAATYPQCDSARCLTHCSSARNCAAACTTADDCCDCSSCASGPCRPRLPQCPEDACRDYCGVHWDCVMGCSAEGRVGCCSCTDCQVGPCTK
jgi:hypothetical protein